MCSCPAKGRTKKDRLEGPTLPTKFKLLEVKRSPAKEPAAHCLVSGDQSSRGCTGAPSPYPAAFFPRGRFPAQGPLVVFLPSPRARRAVGTAPQAWGTGAGFHLGPACGNGCDGPPGAGLTAPLPTRRVPSGPCASRDSGPESAPTQRAEEPGEGARALPAHSPPPHWQPALALCGRCHREPSGALRAQCAALLTSGARGTSPGCRRGPGRRVPGIAGGM